MTTNLGLRRLFAFCISMGLALTAAAQDDLRVDAVRLNGTMDTMKTFGARRRVARLGWRTANRIVKRTTTLPD